MINLRPCLRDLYHSRRERRLLTNYMINQHSFFKAPVLFNEKTFYKQFLKDLESCSSEVIIESPYITSLRMELFEQVFQRLLHKNIKIKIITREPSEHETEFYRYQATDEILKYSDMGIKFVLLNGFHHRKLSVIDKKILWEGSLNILSQTNSLEIMRRIDDAKESRSMIDFLNYSKFI